jgi:hypothetical protein
MCAVSGIEVLKVTATDKSTMIQGHDLDKTVFVKSDLIPLPSARGEFGIMNLKMLSGLLKIKPEETIVTPKTRTMGEETVIDNFEFRNGRMKSIYRLMASAHIPQQPDPKVMATVPWTAVVDDMDVFSDFASFAGLYAEVDKYFGISVIDEKLVCSFGQEASSMQSGMLTVCETDGMLDNMLTFPVDKFIMMLKLGKGRNGKLKFTHKGNGLLGMEIETGLGSHTYYLRQVVR